MTTAYYFTMPPPPDPERDAVLREAALLAAEFPGVRRFLSPGRLLHGRLPVPWWALAERRQAERLDADVELHHVFADDLRWCRLFDRCATPYVVSLSTALGPRGAPPPPRRPPAAVTVRLARDREALAAAGWTTVRHVPAGARLAGLAPSPPPPGPPWRLLFASAPWTRRQFVTKGLDALLDVVAEQPELRLVLLWRGVLERAARRRIARRHLAGRVELVPERVDVGPLLARSHAAVLFSTRPRLVVPHPHSLLEALAAGRPVALSRCLGLAEAVAESGSGVIVDDVTPAGIRAALSALFDGYAQYQRRAAAMDCTPWAADRYLESFRSLRAELAAAGGGPTAAATAARNDSQP